MAGRAYLTQRRDDDGKWAGGFARRIRTDRAEDLAVRSKKTAAQRVQATRKRIKQVDYQRAAALEGKRVPIGSPVLYHSPKKIDEARRSGNNPYAVKPRAEALATARNRTTSRSAQRAVAFNPLSGRFTDTSVSRAGRVVGEGSRQVTKASAARKKAATPRGKLAKPSYVGRRRAEP